MSKQQTQSSASVKPNSTTASKPKSLTKLPMPPGVNVNEFEDINTPSPPGSTSPVVKQTKSNSKPASSSVANKKGGLLTLPMPPMVPGSEELSGDDDYISSPVASGRSSAYKQNSAGYVTSIKLKLLIFVVIICYIDK